MNYKEQLQNLAQKFQKGGQKPYSEKSYDEADIKDFYKKMVGSDWYKNRLIKNGYNDQYNIGVEGVLKKRMNRIDKAHLDNVQDDDGFNNQLYRFLTSGDFVKTGTGAYYNHDEDEITLVKSQMDRRGLHPRSVLAHEFGHAETGKSISNIEQEMLGKLKPDDKLTTHNKSPFENKSDINTLRYNLYKNNLYDPSTGKFKTKSGLFESKLLEPVDTDFTTKRLQQHYGNKYLEFLMNTIAQNDSEQTVSYAQVGGKLEQTKDWWNRYLNSPKYLERLQKEFPDSSPEQVQRELEARKLNLSKTYPIVGEGHFKGQEMKNVLGYVTSPELDEKQYSSFTGKIKNFIEDHVAPSSRPVYIRNWADSATYNHETSHSVDESGRRIPLKTVANLVNKVRGVEPVEIVGENENSRYLQKSIDENTVKSLENVDNYYPIDNDFDRNNGSLYPDIKWKIGNDPVEYAPRFGYRGSPTEVIARLQPLREELYRKGIHDSATEDISKETLMNYIDQTFQNENEPVSDHLMDLLNEVKGNREQGVENLQWMLNNIAQRDEKNKKPVVAQTGGNIGNSFKDQLNALAQKFQK